MARKKLLLLGAGPTSSLIAYNIKCSPKLRDVFDIFCWEKSQDFGGRFGTFRSPSNINSYADLGAQYLTWSGQSFSKPYFDKLADNKILQRFDTSGIPGFHHDATKTHYICKHGAASVVKYLFNQCQPQINVTFNKEVTEFAKSSSNGVSVTTANGDVEIFEIVISTIPVPQLLETQNISNILSEGTRKLLESITYTTRFALGLFYDSVHGPFTATPKPINFVNDDIVRYWSAENVKRGSEEEPCAIVIHSSIKFGAGNRESDSESIKDLLLEKARQIIPEIQELEPTFVICHKWLYSQVESAFPGEGEPGFIRAADNFIAAGDGFTRSGFEGCILSAIKVTQALEDL